ncbi:MAG: magnesium/cobalt transporter CorA [Calditrichia bacterium]|nr:magnesium/cobalt transporter CorA [Calditrichota bacterium]MCB0270208.1 magnesium/cobalt transporter CorA [Calditrichota bacterium]MCB0287435.1 magnesium/cobalt transporter CorA [Calditrichota bacterium]MCB9069224.1 magnesium/cobalt transporter CorA [Calditrichia bacterium]
MSRKSRRKSKVGLPPGSMVYTGSKRTDKIDIQIINYKEDFYEKIDHATVEQVLLFKDTQTVSWINIIGLHDINLMEKIAEHYNIHPLVVEDILSPGQRPKIEIFDDFVFIVVNMLRMSDDRKQILSEQVSIILRNDVVITFQEIPGDVFDPVRERIRLARVRIRKSGTDYLMYALLDVIVDNYFLALEELGNDLESVEEQVLNGHDAEVIQKLFYLKRQIIEIRKSVWPLRETVTVIHRQEVPHVRKSTERYIADLYDHIVQIIETVENYRESTGSVLDTHFSIVSNRMNEVMKVLTIISTIFIPLSFLAGVYGMNFDTSQPMNLPELGYQYGYLTFWGVCVVLVIGLLFYFRNKRWL